MMPLQPGQQEQCSLVPAALISSVRSSPFYPNRSYDNLILSVSMAAPRPERQ